MNRNFGLRDVFKSGATSMGAAGERATRAMSASAAGFLRIGAIDTETELPGLLGGAELAGF